MRPLQLTIEGLRSFRSPPQRKRDAEARPPTIDFGDRGHIAIIGDTGAGKSSILEAMTYALYGQTTFTARANQELMNDTSEHLRVVFRFRVSGETWEVARTARRDGKGGVGQVRAQLRRLGGDGEALEQVEQVRRVNERVEALLGLDSGAFLRTVILPQGRFARLLVEDEPRERSRVLRQVWRTDELEAAGRLAGAARQEAATLCARLDQAASGYPDDPAAHLAQLQEQRAETDGRAAAAADDERAADAAREAVGAAEKTRRTAGEVLERLRALDTARTGERLAPIAALDRGLREEDAALQQRLAELAEALARIPADDGPTPEDVAAALATLERLPGLAAACEETAAALRAGADDAAQKHADAARLAEALAAARKSAAEHAAERPPLDEAVHAARERRDAVDRLHARCADRAAARDEAHRRLEALRSEAAACASALAAAQEAERRTAGEAAAADEHLAAARRSEAAAAAARDLHPGDDCPVCRRGLPAGWQAPDAAGLRAAEQDARAAHAAARDASRAATARDAERQSLERQAADAERQAAAARAAFQEARRALAQHAAIDGGVPPAAPPSGAEAAGDVGHRPLSHGVAPPAAPPEARRHGAIDGGARPAAPPSGLAPHTEIDEDAPLPGRDVLLAPLEEACTAAAERLAEHDDLARQLGDAAAQRDKAAGVAREAATAADRLADHSRSSAAAALQRLTAAVRSIPPPFRPRLALPVDAAGLHAVDIRPVHDRTSSAQERKKLLEARGRERDALQRQIDGAREGRSAVAKRRADEVDAPLEALVRALNADRDVLVDADRRLEHDGGPAGRGGGAADADRRLERDGGGAVSARAAGSENEPAARGGVPGAVSSREAGALASYVGALQTAAAALSRTASERAQAASAAAVEGRAALAALAERLGADAGAAPHAGGPEREPAAASVTLDPTDLDAVVRTARTRAHDARFAARRAREAAERFAAVLADVEGLRALLAEVQARERALGDLEDALKPGAFLKWLTLRRSRRLLVHASRMLEEISGGKYAFADPGDTEEQWRVIDRDSGQARSPASLSGGEQFIASLSLALGMVEMMARSGGRLESLFLDEGFGSLDRNNLDAAVQALGAVAARGRMVGVISHVRAVAEQIDHVLAVTRGPAGSRADWLTAPQRRRLSESDTGAEAAAALAGLLE